MLTDINFHSNRGFQGTIFDLEDTLTGLKIERVAFWNEIREWLANHSSWNKVKIEKDEIPKEKMDLLVRLNLPLTPTYISTIISKYTNEIIEEVIQSEISPIVRAIYLGDIDLVKVLLNQGFSASLKIEAEGAKSFREYFLLDIAIFMDHLDIFNLLIEKGAFEPNGPQITLKVNDLRNKPTFLKTLIKHGWFENISKVDFGGSPLHWAVKEGNLKDLAFWLDMGANVDIMSSYKRTPLQIAVERNNLEITQLLLQRGANPTLALLDAASDNHLLKLLLENGANPEYKSELLDFLIIRRDVESFDLVVSYYKKDHESLVEILIQFLEKRERIRQLNPKDQLRCVRILAEKLDGHNIEIKGLPLLHHIAIYNEELAISLIKGGSNPNLVTSTGISVLHLSVILNLKSLTLTLFEKKVDLAVKDYTGATPLNHALNYDKTHSLAAMLIMASGGTQQAEQFYLYNSYKLLGIKWLSPHIKKDPLLHAKWKEMNLGKLCAHLFELDGHHEIDGLSFHREGMICPRWMIKKIGQCPNKREELDSDLFQSISSLCAFTANPTLTNEQYLEKIKANHPVAIIMSANCHYYYILFYKDNYAVCDGNFESLRIQKFQQENLTTEIIRKLRFGCSIVDSQQSATILRESVEQMLGVKPAETDYQSSLWVKQKLGNCNWKSFEMLIHSLVLLKNGNENFIEAWLSNLKFELASQYISHSKNGFFPPDQMLLNAMTIEKYEAPPKTEDEKNKLIKYAFSQFMNVPTPESLNYFSILPK